MLMQWILEGDNFSYDVDVNGSVHAGLQGLAEDCMKVDDRLPVVNPGRVKWVKDEEIKTLKEDKTFHMYLNESKKEASRRLMALVSLYWVAKDNSCIGQEYATVKQSDPAKSVLLASAFAIPYLGLVAYKEARSQHFEWDTGRVEGEVYYDNLVEEGTVRPVGFLARDGTVTELDTVDPKHPLEEEEESWGNIQRPVCEVRHLSRSQVLEALNAIKSIRQKAGKGDGWMDSYTNIQTVRVAATIVIATKLNYFQTNHHTGQGQAAPFICKIVGGIYDKAKQTGGQLPRELTEAV